MPFGKYQGRSLPEIIVLDLDWFFWALPKLYGRLGAEARSLAQKARAIKIPKSNRGQWEVEYQYDCDQRFLRFTFVKADAWRSRWSTRLPYLDLRRPLRQKYDKRAGRILIRDFRNNYFGKHKRLTTLRCETFFSNDKNFLCR